MNELALFAGAGGGILGGKLLGWRTVCAVEWEPYPASVLCARQNDGLLPSFPIWDDVQTFDGHTWRGLVDVVSGGFPCQDISAAGKGAGIDGERSGMWREMARIIHEVRPKFVFVENSPMLTSRGLGTVLGDLAAMGFDAKWGVLVAADIGANHQRDRIWIVAKWRGQLSHAQHNRVRRWKQQQEGAQETQANLADTKSNRWDRPAQPKNDGKEIFWQGGCGLNYSRKDEQMAYTSSIRSQGQREHEQSSNTTQGRKREAIEFEYGRSPNFWSVEPNVGRVADGVAARVDRLKAIGNGQVPLCAATAWRMLSDL